MSSRYAEPVDLHARRQVVAHVLDRIALRLGARCRPEVFPPAEPFPAPPRFGPAFFSLLLDLGLSAPTRPMPPARSRATDVVLVSTVFSPTIMQSAATGTIEPGAHASARSPSNTKHISAGLLNRSSRPSTGTRTRHLAVTADAAIIKSRPATSAHQVPRWLLDELSVALRGAGTARLGIDPVVRGQTKLFDQLLAVRWANLDQQGAEGSVRCHEWGFHIFFPHERPRDFVTFPPPRESFHLVCAMRVSTA